MSPVEIKIGRDTLTVTPRKQGGHMLTTRIPTCRGETRVLLASLGAEQAAAGPLTAAQLSVFMFTQDTEGNRRRVRAIASAARPRIVSFPGSNGYDLWERCSEADLKHGIAAIRRQASSMHQDATIYQGAYDRRFATGQLDLL